MLEQFKLTILSENRASNPNLIAEQGLSFFIYTEHGNLLFDTGQTDAFIKNAVHLGIDLKSVRKIVLSHGHYDHVGGLPALFNEIKNCDVICHHALFNKKFKIFGDNRLEIGTPWEEKDVKSKGAGFIYKAHAFELYPDIWFSGEIPRTTEYEIIDEKYIQRIKESYIHDEMHDDSAMIFNTTKGLIVLMGCGHSGPVNTVRHAMRVTGNKKIHALIGGMHLHSCPEERIEKIVKNLIKLKPDYLVPLHCTGFRAMNLMFDALKERVFLYNVGDEFQIN